jgi:DNA-directed RNA polymerase specialized sigma24 family protein
MVYHDRAAMRRLRSLYLGYFPYLERLFEHLLDTADTQLILSLINETLYELWYSSQVSRLPAALNDWMLRCAIKQARRFLRQQLGPYPKSHGLLGGLSFEERGVVYLAYTGHSRVQVASIMRLSCEAVDALLAHARVRLRESHDGQEAPSGEGQLAQTSCVR